MQTRKTLWEPAVLIVGMLVLLLSFQNCTSAKMNAGQVTTSTSAQTPVK